MPGFTPNFGIQYPCAGETIDPTVFQTFADDVEAALSTVATASLAATDRPRGSVSVPSQSIATGGLTSIAFTSFDFSDQMTAGAGGLTIQVAGWYMVTAELISETPVVASNAYWFAQILRGASIMARHKQTNPNPVNPLHINLAIPVDCNPAEVISLQWQWSGAGGPVNVAARLSAVKMCDI